MSGTLIIRRHDRKEYRKVELPPHIAKLARFRFGTKPCFYRETNVVDGTNHIYVEDAFTKRVCKPISQARLSSKQFDHPAYGHIDLMSKPRYWVVPPEHYTEMCKLFNIEA